MVEAANADKAAWFGRKQYTGLYESSTETFINRIFGIGKPATRKPTFDCVGMIGIIMTRGVIMELMPGEIDAMNIGYGFFGFDGYTGVPGVYFNIYDPAIPRGDLEEGDWAVFYNNPGYNSDIGMWGAENVIKVGDDSYYGWGRPNPLSYLQWKELLRKAYEEQGGEGFSVPLSAIPGYDDWVPGTGEAGFIDVAKLAMTLFDHRKSQSF